MSDDETQRNKERVTERFAELTGIPKASADVIFSHVDATGLVNEIGAPDHQKIMDLVADLGIKQVAPKRSIRQMLADYEGQNGVSDTGAIQGRRAAIVAESKERRGKHAALIDATDNANRRRLGGFER